MISEMYMQASELAGHRRESLRGFAWTGKTAFACMLAGPSGDRASGEPRAGDETRPERVLQCEPAHRTTNVCVSRCALCAFGRDRESGDATPCRLMRYFQRARKARAGGHGVSHRGRSQPDLPFGYYLDILRGLKQRLPGHSLEGVTAVEVRYFARRENLSVEETLRRLKWRRDSTACRAAGRRSSPRVRTIIARARSPATSGWM